jgi:hypothetical protein
MTSLFMALSASFSYIFTKILEKWFFLCYYYDKCARGVLAQGHATGSLLVLLLLSTIIALNQSIRRKNE